MVLGDPSRPVLRRREVTQRRVRPVVVVLPPPRLDDDLGLAERAELLDVEQLVAGSAVQRLNEGRLPQGAGLDVDGAGAAGWHQWRTAQAVNSGPLVMRGSKLKLLNVSDESTG